MAGQQQDTPRGPGAPVRPRDPLDLDESVAGEEDPGASIEPEPVRAPETKPADGKSTDKPDAGAGDPGRGGA